jgi:hypothetical protein
MCLEQKKNSENLDDNKEETLDIIINRNIHVFDHIQQLMVARSVAVQTLFVDSYSLHGTIIFSTRLVMLAENKYRLHVFTTNENFYMDIKNTSITDSSGDQRNEEFTKNFVILELLEILRGKLEEVDSSFENHVKVVAKFIKKLYYVLKLCPEYAILSYVSV